MPDGAGILGGAGAFTGGNFAALLANYIGETVTIFTSSGGQSGAGFTGVVLAVNPVFVRLITRIGPPPGCALGNACTGFAVGTAGYGYGGGPCGVAGAYGAGKGGYEPGPAGVVGAVSAGGWNGYPVYTVGSVTDIPIASIVSLVHNAV